MGKKCNDIDIIRGETIDAAIELTYKGTAILPDDMQVAFEIIKDPSKDVVVEKSEFITGNSVFVPVSVTSTLLGQYFLRVHIQHSINSTIEDIKLEVRK